MALVFIYSLFQMCFVIYFLLKKIYHKTGYRYNPFFLGGLIVLLYNSLGPILIFLNIDAIAFNWEQWCIEEGITNDNILISQLLLSLIGFLFIQIGVQFKNYIFIFQNKLKNKILENYYFYFYLCLALVLLQIYFILTGSFTLGGLSDEEIEKGINPLLAIVYPYFYIIPFISGIFIFKKKHFIFWIAILTIQLFWFFFMNKRSLFIGSTLFLCSINDWSFLKLKVKNSVLITVTILSFVGFSTLFQKLRLIGLNNLSFFSTDLNEIAFYLNNIDNDLFNDVSAQYTAIRPFSSHLPIAHFINIFDSHKISLLRGESIVNAFLNSLPGNFFIKKDLISVNEALYFSHFHSLFDYVDIGDTVILQGLIDFGYLGVPLYLFVVYLFLTTLIHFSFRFNINSFFMTIFWSQLFILSFNAYEESFSEYFISLRVMISSYVISLLLKIKN